MFGWSTCSFPHSAIAHVGLFTPVTRRLQMLTSCIAGCLPIKINKKELAQQALPLTTGLHIWLFDQFWAWLPRSIKSCWWPGRSCSHVSRFYTIQVMASRLPNGLTCSLSVSLNWPWYCIIGLFDQFWAWLPGSIKSNVKIPKFCFARKQPETAGYLPHFGISLQPGTLASFVQHILSIYGPGDSCGAWFLIQIFFLPILPFIWRAHEYSKGHVLFLNVKTWPCVQMTSRWQPKDMQMTAKRHP